MSHYIGDYVVCLMEYGELPSLGVADATQKNHLSGTGRSCDTQFENFSFADGRPSIGSKSSSSGTGGGKNNSPSGDNKNSAGSADKAGRGKKSGAGSDSDDRLTRNRASSGRSSPYTAGAIRRSGSSSTTDGSDSGNQKVRVIADDEAELRGDRRNGYGAVTRGKRYGGNDKYRAITGSMAAEIEKNAPKKARTPTSATVKINGEGENRFGPYKKIFIPPEAKKIPTKEDDNSGFGFGYIIRWLLIAGMILAIIVFFGGQIMNYSNSKE